MTNSQADAHTLTETYETIRRLSDTVGRLDQHAEEARRIAHLLEAELDTIGRVFDPVWDLHTSETWTGRAADHSRRRLDDHQGACLSAMRSINLIIDDLTADALRTATASRATQDALDAARQKAVGLEFELGRFDDVVI